MNRKVRGILKARRFVFSIPPYVGEFLLFAQDRVVVVRKSSELPFFPASPHTEMGDIPAEFLKAMDIESILRSHRHNFAIPNSEISKIELRKSHAGKDAWIDLSILTSTKKYKWNDLKIPQKRDAEFEDYEGILRPIFGDRLSIRLIAEMREPMDWYVPP